MSARCEAKVLIVEDDAFFQRVLKKRLEAEGFQVMMAGDGREGMKAIVTWEPVDGTHTRVTWRLEYRRLLHPAFDFAPLQRAAASQASAYLLDSLLVPTGPK